MIDTMMLATPISFEGNVEQYSGRLQRDFLGKESVIIYDYVDSHVPVLEKMYYKRMRTYKKLGYEIAVPGVYENKCTSIIFDKHEFEYPDDKMIELSKRIKIIVDDKARYRDWSTREDIKANLQVDLILLLDEFDYPPVTLDDVYKEVLEQAENLKKYA